MICAINVFLPGERAIRVLCFLFWFSELSGGAGEILRRYESTNNQNAVVPPAVDARQPARPWLIEEHGLYAAQYDPIAVGVGSDR